MTDSRKPKTVQLRLEDAWALQAVIRHNMKAFDVQAGLTLRRKVNDVILRYTFAEEAPEYVDAELTIEECWLIDQHLSQTAYDGARDFLVQVFSALCEVEHGLPAGAKYSIEEALERGEQEDGCGAECERDEPGPTGAGI